MSSPSVQTMSAVLAGFLWTWLGFFQALSLGVYFLGGLTLGVWCTPPPPTVTENTEKMQEMVLLRYPPFSSLGWSLILC